jgi:integrase
MTASKLTHATCRNAKARHGRYELADLTMPGLVMVVHPSGRRVWAVRTRVNGKQVKPTLGVYPVVSLSDAREMAQSVLLKAAKGINATEERKEAKAKAEAAAGITVRAIATDYMAREERKIRTMGQRRRYFEAFIWPAIGNKPIDQVTRADIVRLLDHVETNNGARTADVTLATLGRLFNWHASRSEFRSPLVRGMRRNKALARSRTLTDAELKAIWDAAGSAGAFGAFVRFSLLTACRRNEAARLEWSELDGTDWILPAARNKVAVDLLRPLPVQALAILASMPRIDGCRFVFTNDGVRPFGAFSKFKARLDAASGVTGWVIHDLRRSARSLMSRAGVPGEHAERCLGHVIRGVAGIYDRHEYRAEKKLAYERLATLITSIVEPTPNVIAMRR